MSNTTSTAVKTATTAEVRAWFNHPRYGAARLAKVSEKAQHTVKQRPMLRGRLHTEAVEFFNEKNAGKVQYVTGSTKQAIAGARAERDANRKAAQDKGLAVSLKGPLSNEARTALGLPVVSRKK